MDFNWTFTPHTLLNYQGSDIEKVDSFKYLVVHLNNKLDWSHTDALFRNGKSRQHLLRRLRSFGVSRDLFRTFSDTVVGGKQHRHGQEET